MLQIKNVREKIATIENDVHRTLRGGVEYLPHQPARDVTVLKLVELPLKKNISSVEGQARLLHDLANIELQAMELAYRTLVEFPAADFEFREQLGAISISESSHLKLCLDGIESLGFRWGDWPVHLALWNSVSEKDSLLDRILIVHRYLEGSGLDAGETLLRKLEGQGTSFVRQIVKKIVEDEIEHVKFGSRWYKQFCNDQKLDPNLDFDERMTKLKHVLPRRLEKISHPLRTKAGFTIEELNSLERFRSQSQTQCRASDNLTPWFKTKSTAR